MKKSTKLMNSAMMPSAGKYILEELTMFDFVSAVQVADDHDDLASFIGYSQNIGLIKTWTGVQIQLNRENTQLVDGDTLLIMRLNYRVAPGSKGKEVGEKDFSFYRCKYHVYNPHKREFPIDDGKLWRTLFDDLYTAGEIETCFAKVLLGGWQMDTFDGFDRQWVPAAFDDSFGTIPSPMNYVAEYCISEIGQHCAEQRKLNGRTRYDHDNGLNPEIEKFMKEHDLYFAI